MEQERWLVTLISFPMAANINQVVQIDPWRVCWAICFKGHLVGRNTNSLSLSLSKNRKCKLSFNLICCYGTCIQSLIPQQIAGSVSTSLSCSHSRAHDYFIESINSPCKFFAHQCSSNSDFDNGKCLSCPAGGCGVMGYDADATSARGALYLSTSYHSPYCGKNVACVHNEVSKIGTRVCFLNNLL